MSRHYFVVMDDAFVEWIISALYEHIEQYNQNHPPHQFNYTETLKYTEKFRKMVDMFSLLKHGDWIPRPLKFLLEEGEE